MRIGERWIVRLGLRVSAGILVLAAATAAAKEEQVPAAQVPGAVMKAVEARFAGAQVIGAARETEGDGKIVYEVTIRHRGAQNDVIVTPEGTILVIEKTIAAKDLPPAVAKTLGAAYPRAAYRHVEELTQVEKRGERVAWYEVVLVPPGKTAREVKVTAGGEILEVE